MVSVELNAVVCCKFSPDKECFHPSCDLGLGLGLCPLYRGGDRFTARMRVPSSCSIHDIWSRKRKVVV
jgi:hypothetical protein